jgi:hypothetical protein
MRVRTAAIRHTLRNKRGLSSVRRTQSPPRQAGRSKLLPAEDRRALRRGWRLRTGWLAHSYRWRA